MNNKFAQMHLNLLTYQRSYLDEDADPESSAKSSDPMTINMKYVMMLSF